MTGLRIETFPFTKEAIPETPAELRDWPVVYVLTGQQFAYVGETHSAVLRIRQHLSVAERRQQLNIARVIIDPRFNKSACHDLEAFLIKYVDGDERFEILNKNAGQVSYSYYDQASYRAQHERIFTALKREGLFSGSIRDIENSDLFKFSPFKELTLDQRGAVVNVMQGLLEDLHEKNPSFSVIEGGPGTGKTIVVITLLKLIKDVQAVAEGEEILEDEVEGMYSDFYLPGNRDAFAQLRVGFVIPQQALRKTLTRVFARSPALRNVDILTPWQVGKSLKRWDILVVDEAHRLSQYAAQSFGGLVADFRTISERLFGEFDKHTTQLDWIRAQSDHQIIVMDGGQAVIPADLPDTVVTRLAVEAQNAGRRYSLTSQLRVQAGGDYVDYIRDVLRGKPRSPLRFHNYDLRYFDDPAEMHTVIRERDEEFGLARIVAGFAWPHVSKKPTHSHVHDITIGDYRVQWNRKLTDWVHSEESINEAGSIYTIQGYDLNIAGVIIGPDLVYRDGRIQLDASNYFDPRGNQRNNNLLGVTYDDGDIQHLVENIYSVLLTRGIKGTYLYVVDGPLREYLRPYFTQGATTPAQPEATAR